MCQHQYMGSEDLDFYHEVYQNFIEDDPLQFSFILIGQTESFVTYGIERYHLRSGISTFSSFENYTLRKRDGKRIDNILTLDAIRKIINDNPNVKHPFELCQLEDEELYAELFDVGLTEDGVILVNEIVGEDVHEQHYKLGFIPYKLALPYLSEEAQELVKTMGDNKKYGRDDWYIGKHIGSCGDIELMQREPLWQVFADFNCSEDKIFAVDQTYSLTAYKESNHQYIRQPVFNLKKCFMSKSQKRWAKDARKTLSDGKKYSSQLIFESPANWDEFAFGPDRFFYDENNNILYVPYQKKTSSVDFIPFKFDGRQFDIIRPDYSLIRNNKIGTITLSKDRSIFLEEFGNSVHAYYVTNDLFVPAKIFPYYEYYVGDIAGEEPFITSNPSQSFTAFDSTNNTVYISYAVHVIMGGYGCFDRYHVFRFNGNIFENEGEDAGFWLHPSLRHFGSLFVVGKSKDYLVRIDELRSYFPHEIDEEAYL